MLLSWEIFFSDKVEQLPSQHVQQLLRAGLEGGIDVIDSKMSEGGGTVAVCVCLRLVRMFHQKSDTVCLKFSKKKKKKGAIGGETPP